MRRWLFILLLALATGARADEEVLVTSPLTPEEVDHVAEMAVAHPSTP